jgi:hypothetical protein
MFIDLKYQDSYILRVFNNYIIKKKKEYLIIIQRKILH